MMEEVCLNVALKHALLPVVVNLVLLNSANPLELLFPSVKPVVPSTEEVLALLPHRSVVTVEAPPPPEFNKDKPLTSVVNALKPLSSVDRPPRLQFSEVIAAVPLLLLACATPLAPPADVTLPQPLLDVTSLRAPVDLAVLKGPNDVMPLAVAAPP